MSYFSRLLTATALTIVIGGASLTLAAHAQTPTSADDENTSAEAPAKESKSSTSTLIEDSRPGKAAAPAKDSKPKKDYVIMKLNGDPVKYSEVEELWKGLFPGANAPDFSSFDENVRQNVLRGMVSERLIYQEAVKAGFDKSPAVQKRLDDLKRQIILQTFMEDKSKALVTDSQLHKLYDEKVAAMKDNEEIRARHILVKTEAEAKDIEKQLKNGGDFEKIAKEKSQDKASATRGGDLGYFTKDKMVPEFAEAAFKLKKGEISDPVKTSFGWHIIEVEDRRKVKPPTFDEMKDQLRAELSNKAVQEYVETLLKKADIKYYDTSGKEKPFARELQAVGAPHGSAPAAR